MNDLELLSLGNRGDFDDDSDDIAARFTELTAWINPATVTRGDIRRLRYLLRNHPALAMIDDDDPGAQQAIEAILAAWGIPVEPGNPKAPGVDHRAVQDKFRRCAEPGCAEPARPKTGTRGPAPRRCDACTRKRKLWQDSGNSKPREPYASCCQAWQAAGNGGLCRQCRADRAVRRKPLMPLSKEQASQTSDDLGHAWHVARASDPAGWDSDSGPDEGATVRGMNDLAVTRDREATEWLEANPGWYEEDLSVIT